MATKLTSILLFLFIATGAVAQQTIDNIVSDKDVISYVDKFGKDHNLRFENTGFGIYDVISKKHLNNEDIRFYDSLTERKWISDDFNNDGKKDLIFYGSLYNHELGILAFVTTGDSVNYVSLGNEFSNSYPHNISVFHRGENVLLLLGSIREYDFGKPLRERFRQDTLLYRYGGFVEYNSAPEQVTPFDSIVCIITPTWITSGQPHNIRILNNGMAEYFVRDYIDTPPRMQTKRYVSHANKDKIKELQELVNYIGFGKLENSYELQNVSDLTTVITTVVSAKGAHQIKDYGMQGTFGLRLLYQKIYGFIKNGKWDLAETK